MIKSMFACIKFVTKQYETISYGGVISTMTRSKKVKYGGS